MVLNDNEKELLNEQRKKIIEKMIKDLRDQNQELYYSSTIEIANILHENIQAGKNLRREELEIVESLSARDIQIILSLN